jgi:hypothetical protein
MFPQSPGGRIAPLAYGAPAPGRQSAASNLPKVKPSADWYDRHTRSRIRKPRQPPRLTGFFMPGTV